MKKNSGQSLIEVLVVMVAGSIMIIAVVSLVLNSLKSSQFAQNQTQATKYAQEAIDKIKDIRARDGEVCYKEDVYVGCSAGDFVSFSTFWTSLPPTSVCSVPTSCFYKFGTNNGFTTLQGTYSIGDQLDQNLTRYITLTSSGNGMNVGVKVKWSDSSGDHESNLQTTLNR